jgi:pilus assembly protein CpaB
MARTRGCLWLTAGLVVAVLAGIVAFVTLRNIAAQQPTAGAPESGLTVVLATQAVPVRQQLTAEMLEETVVAANAVPEGAVRQISDAVGKVTMVDLFPGEIILAQRLATPNVISGDGRLALIVSEEEEEVLMAFPAVDLMSRVRVLKPGDHVDLLFSLDFPTDRTVGGQGGDEELTTFSLLQNLTIAAIVTEAAAGTGQGEPQAILFTVSPQDALTLKYVKDAGGILDIVLRAPGVEAPFETSPVDVDFLIDRYRIPIEVGQ